MLFISGATHSYEVLVFDSQLRIPDDAEEDIETANKLILPLARSVAANWKNGNRREAGVALAHVTGSGPEASKLVSSFSRVLKKVSLHSS